MRIAVIGLALLAVACGGPRTTEDPIAQNVVEATAKGTPAAVAAGTCADKPDFVPIYENSKVLSCTHDARSATRRGGRVIYTSVAHPSAILAWSKQQALRSGLDLGVEDGSSINAREGDRRTLRVTASEGVIRTSVTIDWGVAR